MPPSETRRSRRTRRPWTPRPRRGERTSHASRKCARTTSSRKREDCGMCTLIGLWRSIPGYDLVVGMNRDEASSRPSDPPFVWDGTPVLVAPRDRQASGTWLGASGTGLVVALSNHRGKTSKTARSHGQLVLDALQQTSVAGADVFLQREFSDHAYNFRNTFDATLTALRF